MTRPLIADPLSPYATVEYESKGEKGKKQFYPLSHNLIDFQFVDSGDKRTSKIEFAIDNSDQAYFSAADLLKKGTRIRATFGYPGVTMTLNDFVIKGHKGDRHTLRIQAQEKKRTRMGRRPIIQTYTNVRRSDVVEVVAKRSGFSGFIGEKTTEVFPQITQTNETDWQFMARLADLEHRELFVSTRGLHWEIPQRKQRPSRFYKYVRNNIGAGNVLNYGIESLSAGIPGRIIARGFDPLTGEEFEVQADDQQTKSLVTLVDSDDTVGADEGDREAEGNNGQDFVLTVGSVSANDAQTRIDSAYKSIKYGALKLSLTVIGDPLVRARRIILLSGIGPAIDGLFWVKRGTHKISSGYRTTLALTRDGLAKKLGMGGRRRPVRDEELDAYAKYGRSVVDGTRIGL